MRTVIAGIGTAQPEHCFAQREAAELVSALSGAGGREKRRLEAIYRQSRVQHRASVLLNGHAGSDASGENGRSEDSDRSPTVHPTQQLRAFYPDARDEHDAGPRVGERLSQYQHHAPPLAGRACRRAIDDAGIAPEQIRQLVVVSCTGMGSPGLEVRLIDALGLAPDVGRTMIGFMGCHGAINGLRVAQGLALGEHDGYVLMCAVELCSLHFHYGRRTDRLIANALFADGAGAMVLSAEQGDRFTDSPTVLRATGSRVIPGTQDQMSWHIGDHGFEMTLSPDVPELIRGSIRPWVEQWLEGQGMSIADVAGWVIHPGGPRVIDAVLEGLGLDAAAGESSRQVLRDCGNMSSPTVLFIHQRVSARCSGPVVWLAFGPGLVVEAALLINVR